MVIDMRNKRLQARKRYTIEEKLSILKEYQESSTFSKQEVLAKYNLRYDLVYRWNKNKSKLIKYNQNNTTCTKSGSPIYHELDNSLINYCMSKRFKLESVPISELLKYAEKCNKYFNEFNLNQKRNYLNRFLKRTMIKAINNKEEKAQSKFDLFFKNIISKTEKSDIIYMEYLPIWFELPQLTKMDVIDKDFNINILNEIKSFRFGAIFCISGDGSLLPPYLIFPFSNEKYTKFKVEVAHDYIEHSNLGQCGYQENALVDPQNFYNWIQTIYRPYVYPKKKPQMLVVNEDLENVSTFCKAQIDKYQTKLITLPSKLSKQYNPIHKIAKTLKQNITEKWNNAIKKEIQSKVYSYLKLKSPTLNLGNASPPSLSDNDNDFDNDIIISTSEISSSDSLETADLLHSFKATSNFGEEDNTKKTEDDDMSEEYNQTIDIQLSPIDKMIPYYIIYDWVITSFLSSANFVSKK